MWASDTPGHGGPGSAFSMYLIPSKLLSPSSVSFSHLCIWIDNNYAS